MERFDFQSAEGLQLNLLTREFAFLRFPGSDKVNQRYDELKDEMRPCVTLLRTPARRRDDALRAERPTDPQAQGQILISEDGGFKFLLHSFALHGEEIRIRKPRVRLF